MKNFKLAVIIIMLFGTVSICLAAITTVVIGSYSGECTTYARSQVKSLPGNLYTYAQKKAIVNSHTCKAGSVAVIDVGNSIGHVAVVESCDSSGSTQGIQIREANWKAGKITRRTSRTSKISKSEAELKIYGYFRPKS